MYNTKFLRGSCTRRRKMILFEGTLLPDEQLEYVLDHLWDSCIRTIENRIDIAKEVIYACDRIAQKVIAGEYQTILQPLLEKGTFTEQQMAEAVEFFRKENLERKYHVEFGALLEAQNNINSKICNKNTKTNNSKANFLPLGVLFHVAAGNAEGLPFYTVLEGMLTGNVNILKLPSMDDGLSVLLLHEIVKEAPVLAGYVCVLDVPSTNLKIMKQLGDMSDAIVVWGGDEAVRAVRTMAEPATQIISWGHKLSFAYVSPEIFLDKENELYQKELYALARHICETKQLLCNSCQGIFVDTNQQTVVQQAAERFLEILEKTASEYPEEPIGIRGKITLTLYNEMLEGNNNDRKHLRGRGVSVMVGTDSELELSQMFKNCWIKPLPRKHIVKSLKGKRGHLQTVGLICPEGQRGELSDILARTGITRVAHGGNMSLTFPGGAHDGEYPLRRYCKIVEIEQ